MKHGSNVMHSYRPLTERPREGQGLVDVLDRVLDKGLVIAGDIRVNLLDIELLTIKVRLLIASADKAREMGIDWWAHDPRLSSKAEHNDQSRLHEENRMLRERLDRLESQLQKALAGNGRDKLVHASAGGGHGRSS
jgi:hypothetical protein